MKVDDAELLDEFLQEQPGYSPDFKALVIRLVSRNGGDVEVVSQQTGLSSSTIYTWLQQWNSREKPGKKKA